MRSPLSKTGVIISVMQKTMAALQAISSNLSRQDVCSQGPQRICTCFRRTHVLGPCSFISNARLYRGTQRSPNSQDRRERHRRATHVIVRGNQVREMGPAVSYGRQTLSIPRMRHKRLEYLPIMTEARLMGATPISSNLAFRS
jgi:hypothetical protein